MRPSCLVTVALVVGLAACGSDDPSVRAAQEGKPVVITALHPLAEIVEVVAGDDVVVVNLTPVDESPHELELTPRSEREVAEADLAIVLGKGFNPDLERLAAERDGPTLDVLAALSLPDRPGGEDGPVEPHVWLDPTIMGSIVTAVANAVADVASDAVGGILDRAAELVEDAVRLDNQLRQGLRSCERTTIASQHEAFGWFAARYGFTNVAFDGPFPDDDPAPDPARAAGVQRLIDDGEVATVFTETLTTGAWLEELAEEEGLESALLNPYEGRPAGEVESEATYESVMLYNLEALQDALGCRLSKGEPA